MSALPAAAQTPLPVKAAVALSYGLAVSKFCPAVGYTVDPEAWAVLYRRVGLDRTMADYGTGGRYEQLADIAIGPKADSFSKYPRGGCENSIDWVEKFYPDLAPRLIKRPRSY